MIDEIANLGEGAQLRTLSFGMASLKPQIVSMIAAMLKVNRSLQKVEMQYSQISMIEFQELMHAVK